MYESAGQTLCMLSKFINISRKHFPVEALIQDYKQQKLREMSVDFDFSKLVDGEIVHEKLRYRKVNSRRITTVTY